MSKEVFAACGKVDGEATGRSKPALMRLVGSRMIGHFKASKRHSTRCSPASLHCLKRLYSHCAKDSGSPGGKETCKELSM